MVDLMEYTGWEVWWGCIEPFKVVGSCPHVAVVVVLVCPPFPSLRYIYILCLFSLMMSSYSSFYTDTCCVYYCLYRFTLKILPSSKRWAELKIWRAGHRRKGSTRNERRKRKHALGWYGRDCRRGIWRGSSAVRKTLEHDSGDIKSCVAAKHIEICATVHCRYRKHDIDFGREGLIHDLSYLRH